MSERILDPESLAQVETHVDNILILKLYEFIIQANIDLSADGVISSSVVAEMLNDDKSSVTDNAIRFVWETIRNKMVLKGSLKPDAFPIAKILAAVPQIYFQTHPEAIDTLLQLKDETGAFVFLGLADFLGQAAKVVLVKNIVCQDLCDVDAWTTFNQTITILDVANAARAEPNSVVTADDVLAVGKIYAGLDYRKNLAGLAVSNTPLAATDINSDGVVAPAFTDVTGALFGQRLGYYANSLGAGSNMGLLAISTPPGIATAGGANQAGIVFLVSGSTAAQHVGGLPAIYSYSIGADATTLGTATLLNAGTGWRNSAALAAGTLKFSLASKANLIAAGYLEADIKESYIETTTAAVIIIDTGAATNTLSKTALNTTFSAAAAGVSGPVGLGLVAIDATTRTTFATLNTTVPNTFLVSGSSALQSPGAKPAIVQFAASTGTALGVATILEPGENWLPSVLVGSGNTTFVLATEANLRAAGYSPDSKYISGSVGTIGTAGTTTGTVGVTNTDGFGLAALSQIVLTVTDMFGTANNAGLVFLLAQGVDTTAQLATGQPAIFTVLASNGTTSTNAAPVLVAPGTGFLPGARKAGAIKFTLATEANVRAAGYIPLSLGNFSAVNRTGDITQPTTMVATLSQFTSSTTVLMKREFALVANKTTMPAFTFSPTNDSLYKLATNYNTGRSTNYNGPPLVAVQKALQLVKYPFKASATQLEKVKVVLANADVNKPSAFTLIFLNLINSDLLKQFYVSTTLASIVTFIGVVTGSLTPNFNMKYYNILSPVELSNADISFLYGLFAVLSTLGYLAEEVLKATRSQLVGDPIAIEGQATGGGTLTAPAQITLRANDFDRFWSDYIKSQSISRRASLFSDLVTPRVPVAPSGALLLANEDIAALYQEVYDNSRELKSRYTQLVATNGLPYEQQVAERVTGLTSTGTRSIRGIKSLRCNSGPDTVQKGTLLTATSGTTGKAIFRANKDIVLADEAVVNIEAGDFTLVSATVGGFAGNFTNVPVNTNSTPGIAATFAEAAIDVVVYVFSEPIARSSGYQFGGLVFDEDNLFLASALFAKHLLGFYTLDNPTSIGAGAPASGPAILTALASRGKYNVTPTIAAGPLTVESNLYKLFELISVKYGVPLWIVIVAASAGVTTLSGAQQVMIDLFNTILSRKDLVSLVDILSLPKGPWSNGLEPVELLASIIINERALYIDVKPYIETLLNFAKTHLFDTVRAVNTQGAPLIVLLMGAARDDVDRSNIFLMMGTTPEIQLANLTNILSLVKMPKIKLFNYYFAQFSMGQLIDGLPEIVEQVATPTAASFCTAFWHTLFNSLEGIKKLQPYVAAEVLLTYNRSVTPINIGAGTSKSATTSLTFNPTFIIQAYYPNDTVVNGTIKLNALVADMGISFV